MRTKITLDDFKKDTILCEHSAKSKAVAKALDAKAEKIPYCDIMQNVSLDAEIINAFQKLGSNWQIKINDALKDWLKTHPIAS